MFLANISGDFSVNNMIKTGLKRHVYESSVEHNIIDTSNITNIHKDLMKKYDIK